MEKLIAHLVTTLILAIIMFSSSLFIMVAVRDLQRKKYLDFGFDLTAAVICMVLIVKLIFEV